MSGGPEPAAPRPVFLGCGLAVLAVIGFFALIGGCIVFAESGANDGTVTLRPAASYEPGTLEYITRSNFYILTQADGSFLAFSDLDAANRANQGRRCRVTQLPQTTALQPLLDKYKDRISPEARGATVIFQESCFGAYYDLVGTRLDANGPNLDRYETRVDGQGMLVVDTRERTCTERTAERIRTEVPCD